MIGAAFVAFSVTLLRQRGCPASSIPSSVIFIFLTTAINRVRCVGIPTALSCQMVCARSGNLRRAECKDQFCFFLLFVSDKPNNCVAVNFLREEKRDSPPLLCNISQCPSVHVVLTGTLWKAESLFALNTQQEKWNGHNTLIQGFMKSEKSEAYFWPSAASLQWRMVKTLSSKSTMLVCLPR